MIQLTNLDLQNFLSHKDTHIPLDNYRGLVLIEGISSEGHYSSNGAGKSTLLEGIVYALTGDTLRGLSVNDVVNRNYKKNARVSLSFREDDTSYNILRCRKDSEYGDSIILKRNEEDISKRVNKETQKKIEDILGVSYKVLASTVLLGEGLSSKFTQLSDPEKKALIESTLSLESDIPEARKRANTQMQSLQVKKAELDGKLSIVRQLSSVDVEKEKEELVKLQLLIAREEEKLKEYEDHLSALQSKRSPLDAKISVLRGALSQHDSLLVEVERLDREAAHLVTELTGVESAATPHCTLCKQLLSSEESKQSVRESYRKSIEEKTAQMREIQSRLNSLPDRKVLEDKYESLLGEMKEIDYSVSITLNKITSLANNVSQYTAQERIIQRSIEDASRSMDDATVLESEITQVEEEREKYSYFYNLLSPTGIITNILVDALEYINNRLSVYSEVLLDKEYRLSFIKGKISLIDSTGASYQSLSNGEKRRLDIAIQFSLHDYVHMYCGIQLDCCFIDEILDTLDDTGVDNIFDVLRLKLDYCNLRSIFVITHNNSLKDKFDQVITVVKEKNGDSYIK